MINYSIHLIVVQRALTTPFFLPAPSYMRSVIFGEKSVWGNLQKIVKAETAINAGDLAQAWYAGLPFWGVALPTDVS